MEKNRVVLLSGFVTHFDKRWRRLHLRFPAVYNDDCKDRHNTEMILRARRSLGYTPIARDGYVAKFATDCFGYDAEGRRIADFKDCVGCTVDIEAELTEYPGGWYVKTRSVRIIKL